MENYKTPPAMKKKFQQWAGRVGLSFWVPAWSNEKMPPPKAPGANIDAAEPDFELPEETHTTWEQMIMKTGEALMTAQYINPKNREGGEGGQ